MKKIKLILKFDIMIMRRELAAFLMIMAIMLVCSSSVMSAGSDVKKSSNQSTNNIVAKVNGQPIFRSQLEKRILESTRKVKSFEYTAGNKDQINRGSLEQALKEEIAAELFYQEGQKLDIPDADKRIAEEEARIKASLNDEQRKKYSDEYIRDFVKRRFYIHEYMEAQDLINPRVPEEDIRDFYERTKQGYASKTVTVCVRHILTVRDQDHSDEETDGARERAEQARKMLLDGVDFAEVVKKYSQDATSAKMNGNLGCIAPGFMPPEFEKVAFSIKPGAISDVVETKHGYHVMEVIKVKPKGSIPPYETLRDFFEKYLSSELKIKKAPEHVRKIKEKANIEIFPLDG